MRLSVCLAVLLSTFAAALGAASPAAAAVTRLAEPFSSTTSGDCQATACRLDWALSQAQPGDTVALADGAYAISYRTRASGAFTIRPAAANTQPRLIGQAGLAFPTLELADGARAVGLQIETSAATGLQLETGARGIGLEIFAAGTNSNAVAARLESAPAGTALVNSVARTQSRNAAVEAIDGTTPGSASMINVTAVATGSNSWGVLTDMASQSPVLKNSIVRARAKTLHGRSGTQPIAVSYSNFVTSGAANWTDVGNNQKDVAVTFVDEANGNLRPVAASATIDAGAADGLTVGTEDPDGHARTTGSAPDIGAFEYDAGEPVVVDPTPPPPGAADTEPTTTTTTAGTTPAVTTFTPATAPAGEIVTPGEVAPPARTLPPAVPPVLGTSVSVAATNGAPRVRLPGTTRFVALEDAASIPVGSTVDTNGGRVELASVRDRQGHTQTGEFWGGRFVVRQARTRTPYTELVLAGGSFRGCPRVAASRPVATAAAEPKKKRRSVVRTLWGSDHKGHFRTRGRTSVATVRGTVWGVQDRCDGTLTRVRSGSVLVRENRGREVVVRAGGRHLARRTR